MKKEDLAILVILFLLGAFLFSVFEPIFSTGPTGISHFEFKDGPESGGSEASAQDLASSKQNENRTVNEVLDVENKTLSGGSEP